MTEPSTDAERAAATALTGNDASRWPNKMPVRHRILLLLDEDSWVEDGLLASAATDGLPADGVLTGVGTVQGRSVAVIAHDFTVKAGSWGELTCEKQIRILERADRDLLPVFYLVDSAGGRLTDQLGFFSGRRGAARIFQLQVKLSGRVPQLCCLLGPSAAGGAYMPAFTDWVGMVEGNASMYLASPRIAEKVTGEHSTLEEMGGAVMHATVSGCGDEVFAEDWQAIAAARLLLSYLPDSWRERPQTTPSADPEFGGWPAGLIPPDPNTAYDVLSVILRLVDAGSFFEIKPGWAQELVTGFGRVGGRCVGIIANQPSVRSGAIFVDSADKAARFISLCDAFNIPLLFLQDVPGFMVGAAVERQGIIRHGAKMVTAMASAEVPKFTVVLRKAYAAGFYAMCSPGFEPRATLALPTATIGTMAAEASVNAVPGLPSLGVTADAIRVQDSSPQGSPARSDGGHRPDAGHHHYRRRPRRPTRRGRRRPGGVVEAMRMENPVTAHKAGTVTGLRVVVGDSTTQDAVICELIEPTQQPRAGEGHLSVVHESHRLSRAGAFKAGAQHTFPITPLKPKASADIIKQLASCARCRASAAHEGGERVRAAHDRGPRALAPRRRDDESRRPDRTTEPETSPAGTPGLREQRVFQATLRHRRCRPRERAQRRRSAQIAGDG